MSDGSGDLQSPIRRHNRPAQPYRMTASRISRFVYFMLTILSILSIEVPECNAWRNFIVKMTNVSVEFDRSWMDVSTSIGNVNNETVLEVHLTVLKDVPMAWAHTTIVFVSPQKDESLELLNTTVNLCQLMASEQRNPVYRKIITQISTYGSIFESCPIKASYYFLQNLRIDENLLPPYTPDTFFEVRTRLYLKKGATLTNQLIDARLRGKIDKTKGFDNFRVFSNMEVKNA